MSKIKLASMQALENYTQRLRKRIEDGQIIQVGEEDYIWHDNTWHKYEAPKIEMSYFDMNAQLVAQLPNLTEEQINDKIKLINEFEKEIISDYYALLSFEFHYFTVFVVSRYTEFENLGDAVITCLENYEIKSIERDGDKIEIWIMEDEKVHCLYLCDYHLGIVEYGK